MSSILNVRHYNNKETLLFPPSISDFLPKDDLAHVVDEAVEEIDLTPYCKKLPQVGNPSYHPAMMIKLWFYGYATQTYSSRKIENKLSKDIAFIYLSGMQKPDFKTISEFRRKNIKELRNSFVEILQICHRLGMTKLGEISLDSKVMKANASASETYSKKELQEEREIMEKAIGEYLEEANRVDTVEDKKFGSDKRGNELPEGISRKEERIKKMKEVVKKLKKAEERLKAEDKEKINLTDSDAQFQKNKGRVIPGYRGQVAVDSEHQVVVANDVTNEQNDAPYLIPMVEELLENVALIQGDKNEEFKEPLHGEPIKVCADAGYSSGSNLSKLEGERYKNKIDPYIPQTNSEEKERGKGHDVSSPFHRSKFKYNKRENSFTCPCGKKLRYTGQSQKDGVKYSVYRNYCDCKVCEYFGKCTTNKNGRFIWVSEHQPLIEKMKKKLKSKEGKGVYGKRKAVVEPAIGNMSYNLGFREFLLRGTEKVRGEYSLICTAHNLLKIRTFLKKYEVSLKEMLIYRERLAGGVYKGVILSKSWRIRERIISFFNSLSGVRVKLCCNTV